MAGESQENLLYVQAGKEVAWGTPVTPTVNLRGVTSINLEGGLQTEESKEIRQSLCLGQRADPVEDGVKGKISGIGTYEHLLYWLEALFRVATPSGGPPNYSRSYPAPLVSVPTRRWMTLVYGDSTNCYQASGIIVSKLNIKIPPKGYVTWAADVIGKQLTGGSLNVGATSVDTQAITAANLTNLYIDAWGGTAGTTNIPTTLMDAELEIDSGATLEYLPGAILPSRFVENGADGWKASLKLTMVLNTTSKSYVDSIVGASTAFNRQIVLRFSPGGAVLFRINYAGRSSAPAEIFTLADGRVAAKFVMERQYNPTLANWLNIQTSTTIAAL